MGSWFPYYFLSFPLCFNQRFQLRKFISAEFVIVQQALHHRCQCAIEGMFQRVKEFAFLGLRPGDGGAIQGEVADFLRSKETLGDHPIHQGANGAVGPLLVFVQLLLNGGRGARFVWTAVLSRPGW